MLKRRVRQCNAGRAQMVRSRQPDRAGEQVEADAAPPFAPTPQRGECPPPRR